MAAYLYESLYCYFPFEQCTQCYVDYVEPTVVPGNTAFVAGFVQCTYNLPVPPPVFTRAPFSCHWRLFSQHVSP